MIPGNKSEFSVTRPTRRRRLMCLTSFIGMVVIMVSLAACSQPEGVSAKLGEEFSLAPAQSVSIEGEPLELRFQEVISDSRCPAGVTCVWEGEASCLVDVTYMDSTTSMVLTQRGSSPGDTNFEDYRIRFQIQPYPEAGEDIDKKDYRLELTIDKE